MLLDEFEMHAIGGLHGAPSGALGFSMIGAGQDAAVMVAVYDPRGLACDDDEANRVATEIARRWNAERAQRDVIRSVRETLAYLAGLDKLDALDKLAIKGAISKIDGGRSPDNGGEVG